MKLRAIDGVQIDGRVFGRGPIGIVLAHGDLDEAQQSWYKFASALEQRGYRVLTLDLRGYCPGGVNGCSGGFKDAPKTWQDVAAAVDYLRARSTDKVFLMGASLGGHTCLWAAAQPGIVVSGVISVSSPQNAGIHSPQYDISDEVLRQIKVPKLFVAGKADQEFASAAQSMYMSSSEPKRLVLADSDLHGADLIDNEPSMTKAALDFLAAPS